MKLRLIALCAFTAAMLAACNKPAENARPEVSGPIEYAENTHITPDAKKPIVIDFNAKWCGPCQRFAPTFDAVAKELSDKAIFISVNIDNSPATATQFGVTAVPQISILMPDGSVRSTIGFMEKSDFLRFLGPIAE